MSTTMAPVNLGVTAKPDMTRDLGSILSGVEKRLLVWMAHRMPAAINSDHLTALGLLGMLGAGLSFWAASEEPLALIGVPVFSSRSTGLATAWTERWRE